MLESPLARLIGRALVVFLISFLTALQAADEPFAGSVLQGAFIGAALAALELLTPLNKTVGAFAPK